MLRKITINLYAVLCVIGVLTSCDNKEDYTADLDLSRSELIFTPVLGDDVLPHEDHFHGLDNGILGQPLVLKFDKTTPPINNVAKIKADVAYKIELKTWDKEGNEIQDNFIKNKVTADKYKAFLQGGNFILNQNSETDQGALFFPREKKYGDGNDVVGKYEVTGVLSYFILGKDNVSKTPKKLKYVLRELKDGEKSKIERGDWNRDDYEKAFVGKNILELNFELQVEDK